MRNYRITINGNSYNVTVEDAGAAPMMAAPVMAAPAPVAPAPVAPAPAPAPVAAAPAPAPAAPAPAASAPQMPSTGSGTKVESPMPGTVLRHMVSVGDTVSAHQVVTILEAMKMENEIVAPVAGKVTAIVAQAGSSVNSGDVLLTIE